MITPSRLFAGRPDAPRAGAPSGPWTARVIAAGLAALAGYACSDDRCDEPAPRGSGGVGDPCESSFDCEEGLACVGTEAEGDLLCGRPSALPGDEDPGCLEHADDWEHHEFHLVHPPSSDDEGCDLLVFNSGCNCIDSPSGDPGCVPVAPFYREEVWRSCTGCCWRLVSFFEDRSVCEPE